MTTIVPNQPDPNKPLPMFRQDLRLYPGPANPDGSPTYNLYDPVRAQFFKINWMESLVFKLLKPGMTLTQLIDALQKHSTLKVTEADLIPFFQDAAVNNLLAVSRTSTVVEEEAMRHKIGWFKWLIYHYLYVRIPLVNPDRFLARTLKYVTPLFSKFAFVCYVLLILTGLVLLIGRFNEYLHTFPYFFNMQGAIIYALGITFVKIIHEFSHAYTAKYYGIHVPAMGVALIVFWPVLYTDVTDSWKLAKRPQRLAISFAGIAAELIVAGVCTLGWALTNPGFLQSIFFVISSVTWVSTLVVNLNPALRFDGYYILSDLWGVDNLQPRSFAVSRWQIRKWLLGFDVLPPEDNLSESRKIAMLVYSMYTWIYRLFLYTAIAIFVYVHFTKVLGIFLFILEIGVFIIWPLASEIEQVYKLRAHLNVNKRSVITGTILGIVLLWLFIPLPHTVTFAAITIPHQQQIAYVPYDAKIEAIFVKREDKVAVGQPLIQMSSPLLDAEIAATKVEKEMSEKEQIIASQTEQERQELAEKIATEEALSAKLIGLLQQKKHLLLRADIPGTIFFWDEDIHVGQHVAKDQIIGKIADPNAIDVVAFVPERNIQEIKEGEEVVMRLRGSLYKVKGKITQIQPIRDRVLTYPQLASINHGDLPVTQDPTSPKRLFLVESYYMVIASLDNSEHVALRYGEIGDLDVRGPWRSYFMQMLRFLNSLLWSEGTL